MSELIDRQALLDECLNHYEVGNIEQNCTMDWICKTVRNFPAASTWHRVEEPPKESGKQYAVWAGKGYAYCDKWLGDRWLISSVAPETVTHWMPIEPPKEDA